MDAGTLSHTNIYFLDVISTMYVPAELEALLTIEISGRGVSHSAHSAPEINFRRGHQ